MPCAPEDLVYDDNQKQCDWESDSNVCKVQTEAPTTEASTTETPVTEPETETPTTDAPTDSTTDAPTDSTTDSPTDSTTDAPTDSTTDAPTDSTTDSLTDSTTDTPTDAPTTPSSGFVCSEEDIANTGCMGPKDCLYPNPGDCVSYIQCVPQPDGSGEPQVMPCPGELEWNDTEKICDWPENSTCPKG
jgi:hypothetical protein